MPFEITHTFYDFEIERIDSPDEIHLVKILAVDGRRFTYELRAPLLADPPVQEITSPGFTVFRDQPYPLR